MFDREAAHGRYFRVVRCGDFTDLRAASIPAVLGSTTI
jgi:hypothetical protein